MRRRRQARRLPLVLSLAGALVFLSVSGSTAADLTIEAAGGAYGSYYWNPAHADTSTGGSVTFASASPSVLHGLSWTGGPVTPPCSGVPIDDGKTGWSGTCSFPEAGNYTFVCPVHPTEMKGTITAGSAGPGPSPNPPGPPQSGPAAAGLKLAKTQRGPAVRGSINVLAAAGRLEVELLVSRSLLFGPGKAGKVQVGRVVRSGLAAGRAPFAVPLKRVASRALGSRDALPLSARVAVTAADSDKFQRTRGVIVKNGSSESKGDTG